MFTYKAFFLRKDYLDLRGDEMTKNIEVFARTIAEYIKTNGEITYGMKFHLKNMIYKETKTISRKRKKRERENRANRPKMTKREELNTIGKPLSVTQGVSSPNTSESSGSSIDVEYSSSDDDERNKSELLNPTERSDLASYFLFYSRKIDGIKDSKIIRFAKNILYSLNIKESDYPEYLQLLN